jgi:hypothetical protein
VRTIVRLDGFRGLYAGFWSTLARDIPFDAFQFVMYEYLKGNLIQHRGTSFSKSAKVSFCCFWLFARVLLRFDLSALS